MHKTLKNLNQVYSEIKASYNDQRLSKFCGYGKFRQYILPQTSKTFEAHV